MAGPRGSFLEVNADVLAGAGLIASAGALAVGQGTGLVVQADTVKVATALLDVEICYYRDWSAAAASALPEVAIYRATQPVTLTFAKLIHALSLAGDNVNNFVCVVGKRNGAGGARTAIVTYTNNVAS